MPPPNTPISSTASPPASASQGGAVDITTLSIPQIRAVQSRLSSELEHLTNSHAKLRAAQSKFRDCVQSINAGITSKEIIRPDQQQSESTSSSSSSDNILVPLTSSLYVKGKLADREKVIVDVGTGFYVEKTTTKAIEFYDAKVKDLEANIQDLEKIVHTKSGNLRAIEDVLRQKVLSGEASAAAGVGVGAG